MPLFDEFRKVTAAEWREQIRRDLKGSSYEELIWHDENGFDVQPFYTTEDLHDTYEPAFTHSSWDICIKPEGHAGERNGNLLKGLMHGASAVMIDAHEDPGVLKGVSLNDIRVTIVAGLDAAKGLSWFAERHNGKSEWTVLLNPANGLSQAAAVLSDLKGLHAGVDVLPFHNRNCHAHFEVALALAMLSELAQQVKVTAPLTARMGSGSNHFMEIAKFRALHRLWPGVAGVLGVPPSIRIAAETSLTNKTLSDSASNLIRTSMESLAAVLGGCDQLVVNPYDLAGPGRWHALRLAINQQALLKHEAYLGDLADVSCGSYYIEWLTDAIAVKALEAFRKIESSGGFNECMKNGLIGQQVESQAAARLQRVRSGSDPVLGVTLHRNKAEKVEIPQHVHSMLQEIAKHNPALAVDLETIREAKHA